MWQFQLLFSNNHSNLTPIYTWMSQIPAVVTNNKISTSHFHIFILHFLLLHNFYTRFSLLCHRIEMKIMMVWGDEVEGIKVNFFILFVISLEWWWWWLLNRVPLKLTLLWFISIFNLSLLLYILFLSFVPLKLSWVENYNAY